MIDFVIARRMMVDCQVRPSDVTDPDLIAAMLDVPRERFVPHERKSVAYLDRDIMIDGERALLKPMVLAKMIQAVEIGSNDRVLDVAAGTGYSSAVLARLGGNVIALEDDPERSRVCDNNLAYLGIANVSAVTGPLEAGWPADAPYDVVLINGACEVEPQVLLGQLKDGGRLVGVFGTGPAAKAVIYRKDRGETGSRALFDAAAPVLKAFIRAPAFVF
jgi:protein-L-isoaspartate(D-aspartate) O-methyltransferase